MNDEPSASSEDVRIDVDGNGENDVDPETHRQNARALRTKRRRDAVDHILRNLDILIYCHLSALYYMDVSIFRFIFRAAIQLNFLTPKPPIFPEMPKHRPYIGAIFGSNIICLLLHILYSPPSAGEATRGYLHGGMIIDFVGQEGPTSKLRLILLDFFVLALQLVMLSVHIQRQILRTHYSSLNPPPADSTSSATAAPEDTIPNQAQDHDSEERGVHRAEPGDNIELQPLTSDPPAQGRTGGDEDGERDELLAERRSSEDSDPDPFTGYQHGEMIAADVHILDTIQAQWSDYENRRRVPSSTASSVGGMAATLSAGRLNLRIRVGGREIRGL